MFITTVISNILWTFTMCQTLPSAVQVWSHLILLRISELDAVIISVIQMLKPGLKEINLPKVPS